MPKINYLTHGLLSMGPRDMHEVYRAATPLELFFDLVFVIAIAAAASGLHHSIVEAHIAEGVLKFSAIFFAIWLAWMNYAWFASAYDNDDYLFRILTLFIMTGALLLAAGVETFFKSRDLTLCVIGFVIMRLAMVILWLRAAKHDLLRRKTALLYAAGISLVQLYWVGMLFVDTPSNSFFVGIFLLGVIIELCVPIVAEQQVMTPWHRHHIVERYGLLNIIVLGETLLASTMALSAARSEHFNIDLLRMTLAALVIVFSMWWLYFSKEDHLEDNKFSLAFTWGYGHLLIFMAGAAVGAGFAALVDIVTQHAQTPLIVGHYAIAIPIAIYLFGLWFVRERFVLRDAPHYILLIFVALILLAPHMPVALEVMALLCVLNVFVRSLIACRLAADII